MVSALEHIRETAAGYSNLEFDLDTGERGERDVHVDACFANCWGTCGTPISTIVVNNNAAAVLLALNTLAEGGEVIVSRGELVEIGGSFRIPDVMAKSNATLREVGTTNRTRVPTTNTRSTRRRASAARAPLQFSDHRIHRTACARRIGAALATKRNIPLVEDLGSGALFDLRSVGVSGEPDVPRGGTRA